MSPQSPPPKILHIASGDLWAGAEVQTYTLLSTLRQSADVKVAAALLNDGELAARLRAQRIQVDIFPEATLNGLQILLGLRKLMLSWRPAVVHTHRMKENVLGSIANRLALRAPCIRTAHGATETIQRGLHRLPQRLPAMLDRWCGVHLQDRTIAVTADLAAKLSADRAADSIVVIENGVDPDALLQAVQNSAAAPFDPQKIHVGIVGRLVAVKRIDLFLQAAALLRQREPQQPWQFHIFGDGPLREQALRQSAALNIADITAFHGHRDNVIADIAKLDILVMCSDHEGLPMTLLEAMSVGTTIVGHAVGGIAQLLEQGRCGWPVTEHRAEAYAQAIGAAAADPREKSLRSAAATENIRAHYSAALCAKRHNALYRSLIN